MLNNAENSVNHEVEQCKLMNNTSGNGSCGVNLNDNCSFNAHKRINSIFYRGKSWAKQLIKINKEASNQSNGILLSTSKSFETSYDSGIDSANSSSSSSTSSSTYTSNYPLPPLPKVKKSISSSCSFTDSSTSSSSASSPKSATSCNTGSSISNQNQVENYDQVYSASSASSSTSGSSSKASSASHLISPIDESGYLVPIVVNLNQNINHNNNINNSIGNQQSSILSRSFSTRSAYHQIQTTTSHQLSNINKTNKLNNRATICERFPVASSNSDELINNCCIKCNAKLNNKIKESKVSNNDLSSTSTTSSTNEASDRSNSKAKINLLESYICTNCIETDLFKIPSKPPPPPPQAARDPTPVSANAIPTNPPPPLPSQPPPSLSHFKASLSDINIKNNSALLLLTNQHHQFNTGHNNSTELNKTNGIKITPLIICTSNNKQHQRFILNSTSNQYHINSCANCCNSSNSKPNRNSNSFNISKKHSPKQNTASSTNNKLDKTKDIFSDTIIASSSLSDESITYIDCVDLEEQQSNHSQTNMNQFISKLKQQTFNNNFLDKTSNSNLPIASQTSNRTSDNKCFNCCSKIPFVSTNRASNHSAETEQLLKSILGQYLFKNNANLSLTSSNCSTTTTEINNLNISDLINKNFVNSNEAVAMISGNKRLFGGINQRNSLKLSDSVDSFEFLEPSATTNLNKNIHRSNNNVSNKLTSTTIKDNTKHGGSISSYEKSWENSACNILLDKLNQFHFNGTRSITQNEQRVGSMTTTPAAITPITNSTATQILNNTTNNSKSNSNSCLLRDKTTNNHATSLSLRNSKITKPNENNQNHNQQNRRISLQSSNQLLNHHLHRHNNDEHHSAIMPLTLSPSSFSIRVCSTLKQHQQQSSQPQQLHQQPIINSSSATNHNAFRQANSEDIERLLSVSSTNDEFNTNQNQFSFSNSIQSSCSNYDSESSIEIETFKESWYQPNMPRDEVHGALINQEIGAFIIRLSNSCKNCFALSIRVPYFANPNGIAHYLITKDLKNGYKLKGVEKEFKTLKSLVTHYSVMQEILPVTLNAINSHSHYNQDSMMINQK